MEINAKIEIKIKSQKSSS